MQDTFHTTFAGAVTLYIQSGVVTPFMFDVYSFMCGLDPLWCKQDATVHSVVQKEYVVRDSVCGVISFDFLHFPI